MFWHYYIIPFNAFAQCLTVFHNIMLINMKLNEMKKNFKIDVIFTVIFPMSTGVLLKKSITISRSTGHSDIYSKCCPRGEYKKYTHSTTDSFWITVRKPFISIQNDPPRDLERPFRRRLIVGNCQMREHWLPGAGGNGVYIFSIIFTPDLSRRQKGSVGKFRGILALLQVQLSYKLYISFK